MRLCNRKGHLLVLCLTVIFLFSSCYHFESEQSSDYWTFYERMQTDGKSISDFLPVLENDAVIDDMYIFYSDRDLIDSYYTIYLDCQYDEDLYQMEIKRIRELFVDKDLLIENSDSFGYPSLMYSNILVADSFDVDLMNYEYILFDENDCRIVYVAFFDKELNGRSTNIPEKYLPKELVNLRSA